MRKKETYRLSFSWVSLSAHAYEYNMVVLSKPFFGGRGRRAEGWDYEHDWILRILGYFSRV